MPDSPLTDSPATDAHAAYSRITDDSGAGGVAVQPDPISARCLSDLPGIRHGFFTRHGGLSTGIYGSLNCGLGSGDDKAAVLQNRRRVARFLGANDLITAYQVHGAVALLVDMPWPEGSTPPKADAIVTTTRGLAVGVLAADCAPVLFADADAGVVAAAHAGWRGAVCGVLEATIDCMVNVGARRSSICAALGPCINQPAYQVGPEFEAEILSLSADNKQFFMTPADSARCHFDLPGYVENKLGQAAIAAFERQSLCSYANPEHLYSYRRSQHNNEADYGRQISAIVLS